MRSVTILLLAIFFGGCVTHRNIPADSKYPSDYLLGAVYRTKLDLVANRTGTPWFLLPPTDYPRLTEIQAMPNRSRWKYVVVPENTHIQIAEFDLEKNMENGIVVWINGRVLGGPLAGHKLNLSFISRAAGQSFVKADLLMVDTNFIEQILSK